MPDSRSGLASFADTIVRYAAVLLAFLTPLFIIPTVWASPPQGKVLVAAVLIVIALIMWLIGMISSRRLVFSLDPILVTALLIPIAYALSAFFSGAAYSSFVSGDAIVGTVASVFILFGAALVGGIAVEDRKHSFTAIVAFLISAAIVICFQTARIFLPDQLNIFGALSGNTSSVVGSWHDLSIFCGVTLLIIFGLLETSVAHNKIVLILFQILAALTLALLLVINFSDTWYVLAGAAVLFAISRYARSYRRDRSVILAVRSSALWLVFAIASVLIGYYGVFIYNHLPGVLQISQVEIRPSWQGTFQAGQELYQGGRALVFGSGPNTFVQQWALFKPKEVNATNFWNTDFQTGIGVVPTALITVGIVGTLGWLLLTLSLLWAGYKSFRDENEGRLRLILSIVCAFMLLFHVIYSPSIGISILMFLFLGILAGLNAASWRAGLLSLAPQSIFAFVVILVIACATIAGALTESRAIVSTLYTAKAAALYQSTSDLAATSVLVTKAISIDPHNDIAQRAAVEVGLLQLSKLAAQGADKISQDQLKSALSSTIQHGLTAVNIDNTSYQNWLALAGLYQSLAGQGIQGAYEQAQAAWQHAASTTPANPLPHVQLGQIALVQGNYALASDEFGKAISLKPDLALPYYLRSQIESGQSSWDKAVQDAAAAAQLANQDPLGWYNLGVILYAAGDINNAGAALEKAVQLQNNYSDALFALAIIYDKAGAHEAAVQAAQKVVSLNPQNQTVAHVLQNLTAGKPALDGHQNSGTSASSTPQTSPKKR
jgi:tetratricopeptide (TPR) repeat protein